MKKDRIDRLLVDRGLCDSRTRAQSLIVAGKVLVGERRVDKPGTLVASDAEIRLAVPDHPFVSRGGLKLQGALRAFGRDRETDPVLRTDGCVAMDVGASTGGFTDCLLHHGVRKVFAVDVGYGQLAWKLVNDDRVVVVDRTNIRHLKPSAIGEPVDLIVVDCSFIALSKVVPHLPAFIGERGDVVALVKPQFELEPSRVGKGGIVRDPDAHQDAVDAAAQAAVTAGFGVVARVRSPIEGRDGNVEFFLWLKR